MKGLRKQIMADLHRGKRAALTKKNTMLKAKSQAVTNIVHAQMVYDLDGFNPSSVSGTFNGEYCKRVCKLPDIDLHLIIDTHNSGLVRRANKTMEAITNEVTERALLK